MPTCSASASGQNVIPSPYGQAAPGARSARSAIRSRNSAISRDLPTPASATSVTSRADERRDRVREDPSSSLELLRHARRAARRGGPSTSSVSFTPDELVRRERAPPSPSAPAARPPTTSTLSRTSRYVSSPSSTSLLAGRLLEPRRNVDGVARHQPLAGRRDRPRRPRRCSRPVRFVELDAVVALELDVELLQRRLHPRCRAHGPQSVVLVEPGSPKTAMTASPMNFSITPPWRSSSARIASKYRVITSRNASESRASPRPSSP